VARVFHLLEVSVSLTESVPAVHAGPETLAAPFGSVMAVVELSAPEESCTRNCTMVEAGKPEPVTDHVDPTEVGVPEQEAVP
jgi:hypothetical protein